MRLKLIVALALIAVIISVNAITPSGSYESFTKSVSIKNSFAKSFKNLMKNQMNQTRRIVERILKFAKDIPQKEATKHYTDKLYHLVNTLQTKIPVGLANLVHLGNAAYASYMAYETARLIYGTFMYEDAFEQSGEDYEIFRGDIQECSKELTKLVNLVDDLANFIQGVNKGHMFDQNNHPNFMRSASDIIIVRQLEDTIKSSKNSRQAYRRSKDFFKHTKKQFEETTQKIHGALDSTFKKIQNITERLVQDKEKFEKDSSSYMKYVVGSVGGLAVSGAFLAAGPAGSLMVLSKYAAFATGVTGLFNGFFWDQSIRKMKKAIHRLSEYEDLKEHVSSVKNKTLKVMDDFEKQQNKWYSMLDKYEKWQHRRSLNNKGYYQGFGVVLESENVNQVFVILCIFTFIFVLFFSKSYLKIVQLSLCSLFIAGLCVVYYDLYQAKKSTMEQFVRVEEQRATTQHEFAKKNFKKECNWHELSTTRQLVLELSASVFDHVPFLSQSYGSSRLIRNATGYLTNDHVCQEYINKMSSVEYNLKGNRMATTTEVYLQPIKGAARVSFDVLEEAMARLSIWSKLFIAAVSIGVVFLMARRVLFCFIC
ncbi:hypothetical protein AKO1_007659 [Acrasis kona]|uniref:Uncharacterized protein n=1 Tax=Acrasis kona TaxID=1008807 RepID=A0AAW2YQP0_9EUKA